MYVGKVAYVYKGTIPANTSITLVDGTKGIAGSAFSGFKVSSNNLIGITIPNSVTNIGGAAFQTCTGLTSVNIPDSVTSIGEIAFRYCTGLTNIIIPNSVTSIGRGAFSDCGSLTSVTFASGSNIPDANFEGFAFPEGEHENGDTLKTAYSTGKAGTYTRNGSTWAKQ